MLEPTKPGDLEPTPPTPLKQPQPGEQQPGSDTSSDVPTEDMPAKE